MPSSKTLNPKARRVLLYFHGLLRQGAGFQCRGVVGWARSDELAEQLGEKGWLLTEHLSRLLDLHYLHREDVRHPGRTQPLWIYRITQAGADRLASEGEEATEVPALRRVRAGRTDGPVYLKRGAADVLHVLRWAADHGRGPDGEQAAGEAGWMTAVDLQLRLQRIGRRRFIDHDMDLLVSGGMVARREEPRESGRGFQNHYRITDLGRSVRPLRWIEPGSTSREAEDAD